MHLTYDLFEVMPDGAQMWRGSVSGLDAVPAGLEKLGQKTENECRAIDLASKQIVARVNRAKAAGQGSTE